MDKHIGFYSDRAAFNNDIENDKLKAPWIAYIGSGENFEVEYSSGSTLGGDARNIADDLDNKINELKNSFITLTEDEYEWIVNNPGTSMEITPLGGGKIFHQYNPSVFYYTYDPKDLPTEE